MPELLCYLLDKIVGGGGILVRNVHGARRFCVMPSIRFAGRNSTVDFKEKTR
ncbi:MAG: hypothetical protein NC176_08500 [Treponema brennaborense]|nr:hypothetical protein [Prevotella sp.]MCM1408500.1 hypothetical protein [Treponema brennaborense]